MPKYVLKVKAGDALPSDLKQFLSRRFDLKQVERLERLGGRVSVSLAAPYVDRRKGGSELVIDQSFLQRLTAEKADPLSLRELLGVLSATQLKDIGRLIGEPVRSKATKGELISDLIRNLQAEDFWQRISSSG